MHKVAKSAASALAHLVLTTTGLAKVRHRRQFYVDRGTVVPAVVQVRHRFRRVLFLAEFYVNIPYLWRGGEWSKGE